MGESYIEAYALSIHFREIYSTVQCRGSDSEISVIPTQ